MLQHLAGLFNRCIESCMVCIGKFINSLQPLVRVQLVDLRGMLHDYQIQSVWHKRVDAIQMCRALSRLSVSVDQKHLSILFLFTNVSFQISASHLLLLEVFLPSRLPFIVYWSFSSICDSFWNISIYIQCVNTTNSYNSLHNCATDITRFY